MKDGVRVGEATHVVTAYGVEKIVSKSGVDAQGRVDPKGFSVTTESGRTISMWEARRYLKEEGQGRG